MGAEVTSVEDVPGGVQATYTLTIETEGSTKPSCVAEVVYRYLS
jgi:acyl dehydratase